MPQPRPKSPHSREPFLRLARRLYRTDPSLRGFADFAVFGSIALLFVASPIPRQIGDLFTSKAGIPASSPAGSVGPAPGAALKVAPAPLAAKAATPATPTLATAVPVDFVGVGIRIVAQDAFFRVVAVLPDGPAEKAGLRVGSLISEIDGTPVADLDVEQVKSKIQGPAGSAVSLRLASGAEVSVVRATIDAGAFDAPRRAKPISERWPTFQMPRRPVTATVGLTDLQPELALSAPEAQERVRQAFDLIHDPTRAVVAKTFVETLKTDYPDDPNVMVLQGLLVQKFYGRIDEALTFYSKAGDRNHLMASAYSGAMMVQPGPLQDLEKSFRSLKAAADRGSNIAKFVLALRFYDNGWGGRADAPKAGALYTELANAGYLFAWRRLGDFVAKGRGGFEINPKKAIEYLAYGAQQGDPDALKELALFIASGIGTTPDPHWAAELYGWLADRGDADAANALGLMYMDALYGMERDVAKGSQYIRKAAMKNHPAALFNLAHEYRAGIGVPADQVQAYVYFLLADHYGDPKAKVEASSMETSLTAEQKTQAQAMFAASAKRPRVPR